MATKKVLTWEDNADSTDFLESFLEQELNSQTLVKLIIASGSRIKKSQRKPDLIAKTINLLELGSICADDILKEYVKSARMWLSFKVGNYNRIPKKKRATALLNEFGTPGWYGPIQDDNEYSFYYIYIKRVMEPIQYDEETDKVTEARYYRWSVVAKIAEDYAALSWYGFGYREDINRRANQFPFWKHIPEIFEELAEITQASWEYPDLYTLVLEKLWNKYLNNTLYSDIYEWGHLRIKAESSGVALNAKSSPKGPSEINLKGLVALADALATSALDSLLEHDDLSIELDSESEEMAQETLKTRLLKTLIKDWGAMAYEFSLDRYENDKSRKEKVFRAFCNFGLREDLETEDAFQHLKCFSEYGNSNGALKFLLQEMAM
ncbi:hypothetical protein U2F10_35980 [Leptothoe sp. EHU-05/26/07-4]